MGKYPTRDALLVSTIRHYLGMTQAEFADLLQVSRSLVAMVEEGRRPASGRVKFKLSQIMGASDGIMEALKRHKEMYEKLGEI